MKYSLKSEDGFYFVAFEGVKMGLPTCRLTPKKEDAKRFKTKREVNEYLRQLKIVGVKQKFIISED